MDCAASGNYAETLGLSAGSFVINPAPQTASLTNSPVVYTGAAQTALVACSGGGAATLVSGTGTGTNVGSYPATVDCAASGNYAETLGLSAGSFVINKATPTATLAVTNSPVVYDGSPHAAAVDITVSSVPGSVSNILTGGAATQTNVGLYAVTADFVPTDTTNYNTVTGLSAGNFVIGSTLMYNLTVSKTGTGSGTVTSVPAGIACGGTCAYAYDYNTSVTLTAAAATGSTFTGWGGAVHGHGRLRGDDGCRQERDGELHAEYLYADGQQGGHWQRAR